MDRTSAPASVGEKKMSDKRATNRNPSFLGGTITYNNDLWSADCVVRNISDHGAKLAGRNLPVLPDRFDLSIPQKKTKYRVAVRWRARDQLGVAIEHEYPSADETAAIRSARQQLREEQAEENALRPKRLITDLAI